MSFFSKILGLVAVALSLVNCGDSSAFRGKSADFDAGDEINPADVIFLVDTSGSMDEEKSRLEKNMEKFLNKFFVERKTFDYQMFLIGNDFDFPSGVTKNPKVNLISRNVQSNDALDIAQEFLEGSLTAPTLAVRENATKEIVVITDDNAFGGGVDYFNSRVAANDGAPLRVNGFVGFKFGINTFTCIIAAVGQAYIDVAKKSKKPGLIQDLCNDDWSAIMDNLGESITQASDIVMVLEQTLDEAEKVNVVVDGVEIPTTDFSYNKDKNSITIPRKDKNLKYEHVAVQYYSAA
jgi:hypothetical protein